MRYVGFLKLRHLLWRQLYRKRRDGIFQVVRLRSADDRSGDGRFVQQPCERHLRTRDASGFRYLADALDHLAIRVLGSAVELFAELIRFGALRGLVALPI